MTPPPTPQEPFEHKSNVIVGIVMVVLMIIVHYAWWKHGHKYEQDTGFMDYFYYVKDLVYNWILT